MHHSLPEIFTPVAVLMGWTMVMWVWMYATRIPAMTKAKIEPDSLVQQGAKKLDELLPASVSWKAQNYNHLHEAPTVFYAVSILLALGGWGDGMNATIAWVYVALRIIHSIVQSTVNRVMLRFGVFALSSVALMMLVAHALIMVFHH